MAILPFYEDNPVAIMPILTIAFIALNIILFLCCNVFMADETYAGFLNHIGLVPAQLFGHTDHFRIIPEFLTPLTSSFFHASFWHLAGNVFFFFVFADNIEESFGKKRFFYFCIVAAFASSIFAALFQTNSNVPSIGFSGVVSACMGAYLVLYPYAQFYIFTPRAAPLLTSLEPIEGVTAGVITSLWLGYNFVLLIYDHVFAMTPPENGTSFAAHIGGFIFGILLAKKLKKNYETYYDFFNN